jgi:hypothetical protein
MQAAAAAQLGSVREREAARGTARAQREAEALRVKLSR